MSVYRQIGGEGVYNKCVHHYFISFFEKDACSCVEYMHEKWQQDLQLGGWLPSGFYFLPFVYLYFFFFCKMKFIIWKRKGIKFILWVFRGQD